MPKKIQKTENAPQKAQNKPEVATREIDATGKILGRLATQIADMLRGKDKPTFVPNLVMGDKVVVKNAAKIVVTGNKLEQKTYYHHTGYLGHLKAKTLKEVMRENPAEALEHAVYGMLPTNKLRDKWMKNLEIHN